MNLFIDTTNWKLIYLLEESQKIVASFLLDDVQKSSDLAIPELRKFLNQNQVKLRSIQNFYLTTGPGSYTGIRVGMTIVKTLKTINPTIQVHLINSLLFQAGLKTAVSLLDARGQKFYCGIYQQGKPIITERIIFASELPAFIDQYQKQGYLILKDYQNLDFSQNYLDLKSQFTNVQDVEEITPVYIKDFL